MTPEAQRIAIARACGIKNIQKGGYCYIPEGQTWGSSKQLPDYLNDLNAMHEAEKILTLDQQCSYAVKLAKLRNKPYDDFGCFATAAQRAEAFLRTLNLWKE